MDSHDVFDNKIKDFWVSSRKLRQNEIFDAVWDDKINEFFENYKKFDEFLIQKSNSIFVKLLIIPLNQLSVKKYLSVCDFSLKKKTIYYQLVKKCLMVIHF